MNTNRFLLITILLLIFYTISIYGSSGDLVNLRNVTISEGLSGNMVDIIYPDSKGYVWIGTDAGVDRFDGNHIVSYSLPGGISEDGCRFYDFAELKDGRLIAGSVKGLFEIDKRNKTIKKMKLSSLIGYVRDLSVGEEGKVLWVAGKDGFYEVNTTNNKTKKILIEKDALSKANDIRGIHYDKKRDGVWVISKSDVSFYNINTGKINTYKSKIKDKFQSITSHGDMLYMATRENGVCRFDKRTRTFLPPLSFGNNIIMSVKTTPDGKLVVGVDCDGIYVYSIEEQRILNHYDTSNTNMASNSVYYAVIDKRGILWIGYYQAGFGYTPIVSPFLELYSTPIMPDLRNKEVRAFGIEPGYKLIGTRKGLYFIDENLGKGRIFMRPEIQSDVIFSIHKWKSLYYIGTYRGGIYTFDPTTLNINQLHTETGVRENTSCWDIVEDGKGNLWFATNSGVHILDSNGIWKKYNSKNSQLPNGNVLYIFFDSIGRGWIATDNGLAIWDGKEIRSNCFPEKFEDKRRYSSIFEDKNHNLYFIPIHGDLFKSNIELTDFSDMNLGEDKRMVINFMTESPSGRIFLGTNLGLGYIENGKFNLINSKGVISNSIFMTGRPIRNGNITWMGNAMGLVKLNHNIEKNFNKKDGRRLFVTVLNTDKEDLLSSLEQSNNNVSHISINGRELEVGVSDFSFENPDNTDIEYILEGIQKKWRKISANEIIRIENLPSGNSILLIRRQGEPESEIKLEINVESNKAWIYIIAIIFIIGGIGGFIFLKNSKKNNIQVDSSEDASKRRYVSSRISDEECQRLYEAIETVMKDKKPYLNTEFKIQDLANLVGSSSFALSYLFNQYLKTGYLSYVNGYRVEEFKSMIANGDASKFTLTGIALKCGFSSRASFFRHFKAVTGLTPSQYIKEQSEFKAT